MGVIQSGLLLIPITSVLRFFRVLSVGENACYLLVD
jgi:hypothetical protein